MMRSVAAMGLWILTGQSAAAAEPLRGPQAFGDWRSDAPGVQRLISPDDLPAPFAGRSASNPSRQVARPANQSLRLPAGFEAQLFAQGFNGPRVMRVAPNGDVFIAESWGGRILVFKAGQIAAPGLQRPAVFASGLLSVFGIAFGPSAENPEFVYAAMSTAVMRFPYKAGSIRPAGPAEQVIKGIPGGGHSTRDIAFSPDRKTLYVAVGSMSNVAQETGGRPADLAEYEKERMTGAGWGREDGRAALLAFDTDGRNRRYFATGLRNCAGLTINPANGEPWCAVNERDGLGDDLPPDYATSVKQGGFYGWPWYYIGRFEDPRHRGARPDLRGKAIVPDVLFQPHSAPLQMAFYDGGMFPAEYRGDAFVTLHGSWNRAKRTGYKVVRLRFQNGKPTGVYEDFMTGFIVDDTSAWGRPVGVAQMKDGSLLVSEDGSGTIWRITYKGK